MHRPWRDSLPAARPGTGNYARHRVRAGASKVLRHGAGFGNEVALKNFRRDNIVELYNEAGQLVLAPMVYRCWVRSTRRGRILLVIRL